VRHKRLTVQLEVSLLISLSFTSKTSKLIQEIEGKLTCKFYFIFKKFSGFFLSP